MDAAAHAGFIVAAYVVAGAVIGGLIAWVMLDYRAQARALGDLEKSGITRRSSAPGSADARKAEET